MERLINSQRDLYGRIARTIENLRKTGAAKISFPLVHSTLSVLEGKWVKFQVQHDRLQAEFGEAFDKSTYNTEDFLGTVETAYIQQRTKLLEYEQKLEEAKALDDSKSTKPGHATARNVLPRIQMPEFSGKFEDWPAFRDLFSSIVVAEDSLSKVEKFHYLKTSVKGDAEQLIRSLPSTDENFERAWSTLNDHFENKRLLVRSYLAAFTSLPRMKGESVSDLRRIFHGVVSTVGALEGIGRPITNGTDLFVHLMVELLDSKTRREWESSLGKTVVPPSYEELRDFLQEQLMTHEVLRAARGEASSGKPGEKTSRSARANHVKAQGTDAGRSCPLCKKEHFLAFCDQYKRKTAQERREAATTHQRCLNCLGRHLIGECTSTKTCLKCSGRHHTSLHDAFSAVALPAPGTSSTPTVHVAKRLSAECAPVLLATARVLVMSCHGEYHPVRALVDPGSETSLISESLAQRLRLPRTPTSVAIYGVGGLRTGCARGRVAVTFASRIGQYTLTVSSLVLPKLSVYSGAAESGGGSWPHVDGLSLADPEFRARDPVELLLGAEAYASIVLADLRRGGPLEPIAQCTQLGWILMGAVGGCHAALAVSSLQCSATDELTEVVRRFWENEEPPRAPLPLTPDEQECEDFFVRTCQRLPCGRYQVRLPVRSEPPDLSSTRRAASRMLEVMERRFERDPAFRVMYHDFMDEYLALGHMTPSTVERGVNACFLPHHGVLKGSGSDVKIRVVFNGSARTAAGYSLNDFLHAGPNLLPALADVMTRWRRHRYVFTADIVKVYRQILVHPEDRHMQMILWKQLEHALNTVTYGQKDAPYLALKTMDRLAEDERSRFPLGAEAVQSDRYVDDVLSGASTLDACRRLREQVTLLCLAGGFPLKKWAANDEALLEDVPLEHRLQPTASASLPSDDCSVLGLRWSPGSDDFALSVLKSELVSPTKRSVLSRTARLFDPLGWLAPVLIKAKLLIQAAWLQRLDWDAPLAPPDAAAWAGLEEELPLLERVRVPRWFRLDGSGDSVELHGFSDDSERAYAAVVYLRVTIAGKSHLSIVAAKTKVAPLKQVTLARLELSAACLLTKVAEHVRVVLHLEAAPLFLWTDSMVTLGWIRGHPTRWTTFVANRVAEIQRTSSTSQWRHVPGSQNPADCASRGLSPRELLDHPLWWSGPDFLARGSADWPVEPGLPGHVELPEQRALRCFVTSDAREPDELLRFSSLRRLLRVSAWMVRWRMHRSSRADASVLTSAELDAALARWIRVAQSVAYPQELADVRAGRAVSGRSPLRRLTPVIDSEGILRVGGRIKHAPLDDDQRHPAILPPGSHLAYLVIDASHRRSLHGGTQATLAIVRQRYWIPRGRQLVRGAIHRCLPCIRWRAASPQPIMGSLPRARVTPSRPFLHTGVDFAGPIFLRTAKGRGHKAYKAFLAVFVCFSSKAVHLEAVSDYSADAFLAAFRRFVSRRGLCRAVYSDCGTNFVGADNQLRALFQAANREVHRVIGHLADEGVQWHFNPPAAPHFGGLWEAAVKSMKRHLRRVIGETTLTFEEMTTFLAEVEACLNSRPLQALTDDPEDLDALTPGHFLIGGPLNAIPEPSTVDMPTNRLNRWRLLQNMRDHLWQRWSREYLQELTPRPKWWTADRNLREGQLCLIKSETTPPSRWPLARVIRLHPGEDGQVRVVDLRTANGEFTRPVVKLVPLPPANTPAREPTA
ncbi:uncharacterized protein [Temnothorax nylanderi]|uniref:uncharacterized protein n=1 Tax=Temnothorax nylanderi TaxID=102681 RepID=UPI003A86297D